VHGIAVAIAAPTTSKDVADDWHLYALAAA
jgi:hypothetical protein